MVKVSTSKKAESFPPPQYGLHLGQLVKDIFKENKSYRQTQLAELLGITPTGIQSKLFNPIYGSVYDIIKTSEYFKIDLFDVIRKNLVSNGHGLFGGNEEKLSLELDQANKRINVMKQEIETLEKLAKLRDKNK